MNSIFSHNLRKKLAYKYGLTNDEVNLIIRSVFELTSITIQSGDKEKLEFKNVHIPNFGMFLVKDGRKLHFQKIYDKNRHREEDEDNGR
jgi:nucleoid DNA-binding protein